MAKRKTMTGMGQGVNAFFEDSPGIERQQDDKSVQQHTDLQTKPGSEVELKRATFYIRPEQNFTIEEIKLKLGRKGVATNKSELVRVAIDLLSEQDEQALERLLNRSTNQ